MIRSVSSTEKIKNPKIELTRGRVGENHDLSRYFIIVDVYGAAHQFVAPETP